MSVSRRRLLWLASAGAGALVARGWVSDAVVQAQPAPPSGNPVPAEGESGRERQWCMVIDLARCEGCETIGRPPACQEACRQEHFVPAGQQWMAVPQKPLPGGGTYFMPSPCMQCENAPCVNVCPVGASYHSAQGVVLIDHERCIGCRFCISACPYDRRYFNWGDPEPLPPGAAMAPYSPEYPVPSRRGTVNKCMFCTHRTRQGKLPACVEACPMGALYLGDLGSDLASNGREAAGLSALLAERSAYRYKEDRGTRPRVYYLPGHGQAFGRRAQ